MRSPGLLPRQGVDSPRGMIMGKTMVCSDELKSYSTEFIRVNDEVSACGSAIIHLL